MNFAPIAEQTKQKILGSIKDNNPAFLFQPTKNTLFRCLLRPYNQFKKDEEEEKSEMRTDILEVNGKAARRKFRMDQIQRQKDTGFGVFTSEVKFLKIFDYNF